MGRAVPKSVCCLLLVVWAVVGLTAPAEAQIYKWRDAKGQWMYSDSLPADGTRTYRVPGTTFRSTRPADAQYVSSYDRLIEKHATTYSVSPQLVRAVVQVESGFNPRAVSREGALGLMQLMPATAVEMGVTNPFDADQNIRGGVAYLRQLLNRYGGDETLALAAYNAGPKAVDRHGYRVPPYRETQKYVAQVRGRSGSDLIARPVVVGKRAPTLAPPPPSTPEKTAVVYKWWEKTEDGRLIPKFSDTKPANGTYEVVR